MQTFVGSTSDPSGKNYLSKFKVLFKSASKPSRPIDISQTRESKREPKENSMTLSGSAQEHTILLKRELHRTEKKD